MRPNMNDDIEGVLDRIRQNSNLLANYHRKRYLVLKSRLKFYRVPVIVISALNSVGAVSFQAFFPQSYISLMNMFLSLIVGIIGSLEMFFGLQKQMESELTDSKEYYILNTDIYKYLSLTPQHRTTEPDQFLQETYQRYIKLVEASIVLKKKIEDTLVIVRPPPTTPSQSPAPVSQELFVDTSDTSSDNNI